VYFNSFRTFTFILEIDSMRKLRSRHATYKENFSKQGHHILTLVTTSSNESDSTVIQHCAQIVDFNITDVDMLQEQIEDVTEEAAD